MPNLDLTDNRNVKRIVEGCLKGDRKCQQMLYEAFYGKMLAVCFRYSSDKDEARDFLQEGFIKVFEKLKGYKYLGSLEGWIRRIIVNNTIDIIRKKREYIVDLENSGADLLSDNGEGDFEIEEENKIKAEHLLRMVQELSPAYRTVFSLFVLDNYSHNEISEELGISVGTSKSNLAKAKMKLKQIYNEYVIKVGEE